MEYQHSRKPRSLADIIRFSMIVDNFKNDPSYCNRYVAVCDILGFKSLLTNLPLLSIAEKYQHLIAYCNLYTYPVIFSDSIIIFSSPINKKESLMDIASASYFFDACEAILVSSIKYAIPLRIGISYGETYIDKMKGIFVGESIVNAYLMESNQNWIGGACHINCSDAPFFRDRIFGGWEDILNYKVPIKNDSKCVYALNWPKLTDYNSTKRILESILREQTEDSVKLKYTEALKFLDWHYTNKNLSFIC